MATEVVNLNDKQLRTLTKVLYHQEVEAAKDIQFHSEPELVKYLHDCKDGYNHSLAIIDESAEGKAKYANDEEKSPIANTIFSYSLNVLDFALQCVRSSVLRIKYLKNIRKMTSSLVEVLAKATTTAEHQYVTNMVKEVSRINKEMLDYNKKNHNNLSRLFSENVFKETDNVFNQLGFEYNRRLNMDIYSIELDTFATSSVTPVQEAQELAQRQVWEEMIRVNGLENKSMTNFSLASGAVGGAMLLGMGAMMAWDIHTSDYKLNTFTNDGFNAAAAYGGGIIGSSFSRFAGGAAIFATTALMAADIYTSQNKIETTVKDSIGLVSYIGSAGTDYGVEALLMTGLGAWIDVTGAIAACAIGGAAFFAAVVAGIGITYVGNYLYNLITGKNAEAEAEAKALVSDGHKIYVAQMPDGRALARQIAFHK